MKKKLHEDVFVGLVLIVLGIAIYLQGSKYNAPSVDPLGSTFYPKMIGGLLFSGGLLMSVTSLIVSVRVGAVKVERDIINIKVIGSLILSVAYVFLLGRLGFAVTNILFMFSCLLLLGERNKRKLFILPVGFTIVLLTIFQILLNVNLPKGLFWGL